MHRQHLIPARIKQQQQNHLAGVNHFLYFLPEEIIKNQYLIIINSYKKKTVRNLPDIKDKLQHIESCPTCLQDVDSVYRSNVTIKMDSNISENINKIKELDLEKQKLAQEISKLNYDITLNEKEFQDLRILKVKIESIQEKITFSLLLCIGCTQINFI